MELRSAVGMGLFSAYIVFMYVYWKEKAKPVKSVCRGRGLYLCTATIYELCRINQNFTVWGGEVIKALPISI